MQISFKTFTVHKRFALTISRGTTAATTNIWVKIASEGIEGWGEASPFSVGGGKRWPTESLIPQLQQAIKIIEPFEAWERQAINIALQQAGIVSAARAAIDVALHDWMGKALGVPLWRLWGLQPSQSVPISVTVGIGSPDAAIARVKAWQDLIPVSMLKVKLGSRAGIEADKAMLLALKQQAPSARLTVDANGGWSLAEAAVMCDWLQRQGVEYVEQPLAAGAEEYLAELSSQSPLPIFVDESCFSSEDVIKLSPAIDGINIKMMKAGGLAEVQRIIAVARACGLKIMFGCYSDSSLANTAMAHLGALADYLDLDSHLNLIDDPFQGAKIDGGGRLLPEDLPGLGVKYESVAE